AICIGDGDPCDAQPRPLPTAPTIISGSAPLDSQLSWKPVPQAQGYLVLLSFDPRQLHRVRAIQVDDPWLDIDAPMRRQGLWWSVHALDAVGHPGPPSPVFRLPTRTPSTREPDVSMLQ
ncbi:MAG: hypothetical protein AAFX99_34360, partial [Myxococcota bacterium]